MIQKIITIRHVGLFENATPNGAVKLAQATGIFADNGRGKTTLAAILRACSSSNAGRVDARKTIDSQGSPEISLLVQSGNQPAVLKFENNAWVGSAPTIVVFDCEFVDQNVYSGLEVRADQRQSLLEFALGDQTVRLKQKVDQLTEDMEVQTRLRKQAEKVLGAVAAPYSVAQFIPLQLVPDAQQQIEALRRRVEAANNAKQLVSRQDPSPLPMVEFDVPAVANTLRKQLQDVEESAETVVREHLAKHDGLALEDWVSRGQQYLKLDNCPFCGQPLAGLGLIRAYRAYFSKAYEDLKRDVSALESTVPAGLADSRIEALKGAAATNAARIEAWKDQLELSVPAIPTDKLLAALSKGREELVALVKRKQQAPLESVGSQPQVDEITSAVASINEATIAYNSAIVSQTAKITEFKRNLGAEDTETLRAQVTKLEAIQRRARPDVIAAIREYQAADAEHTRLEGEKAAARKKADSQMQTTLQQYQDAINRLLKSFGADFSIEQLKSSYVGGNPRTDYGLKIRNKVVKLGSRADASTTHSFATALGDGDKRTLALAFFVARLETDPQLADKVVVLDDPVSSLDRNRRQESLRIIGLLTAKCRQMIVLSHDRFFIRDFRNLVLDSKPTAIPIEILTIKRVQNGYSAFTPCDIDDVCSSEYYRHHRLVSDYVDGKSTADARDVAKAIRPMLEGYYHRRFHGRIPHRTVFGQIIRQAQQAQPGNPLANLRPLIQELAAINDYAGQFLHDTNLAADNVIVVEGELHNFAGRALDLIYQNG